MKEMLPYYERELAFLRRHSREFAERYPRLASSLLLNGERSEDPHVERMIESFALRVRACCSMASAARTRMSSA